MKKQSEPKNRSHDPAPFNLKIGIENFGPIAKGSITLKPLTIFVGPNNSGKSYAATLIHSILSSGFETRSRRFLPTFNINTPNIYDLVDKDLKKIIKANKGKDSFDIPVQITKKIFLALTQDLFREKLESTTKRNFGSPINDLIRKKFKSAKISTMYKNKFDIEITKKLNVKMHINKNIRYKIQFSDRITLSSFAVHHNDDGTAVITLDRYNKNNLPTNKNFVAFLIDIIINDGRRLFPTLTSYYFPAVRSGILQGHKVLSANIVKNASIGGNESSQTSQLTGVISDFISEIILMSHKKMPFFKLGYELESELFHGHVTMPPTRKETFPEINFSFGNNIIPLHRASSAIAEIAPLSLYLKYIVNENSLLIIEEPESDLHPANQVIFAKHIVRMIRSGFKVLITTHSVFLLEALGKYLLAGKINQKTRAKLNFDKNDYLDSDEVSPYVFKRKNDNEHYIEPIDMNDEDGISQEEFVKVNEELYSIHIKLQENLQDSK